MRTRPPRGSLARKPPDWSEVERRERARFARQEQAVEAWREQLAEEARRLAELEEHNRRLMALRARLLAERLRRRPGLRVRPAVTGGEGVLRARPAVTRGGGASRLRPAVTAGGQGQRPVVPSGSPGRSAAAGEGRP